MARLWRYGMIVFLLCGLLTGREEDLVIAMMDTPFMVLDLVMTLVLSACLWGGFLKIIEKTGFMNYVSFLFYPLLKWIYGPILDKEDVYIYLSSNITANLLGLGTLATLSGIQAFKKLHEHNPHPQYPSRPMMTLVIMNTAGMCLFPSSMIMLRQQFCSEDVYAFYPYMLIISFVIIVVGLCIQRVIEHE